MMKQKAAYEKWVNRGTSRQRETGQIGKEVESSRELGLENLEILVASGTHIIRFHISLAPASKVASQSVQDSPILPPGGPKF